jgi:hypothetical protein
MSIPGQTSFPHERDMMNNRSENRILLTIAFPYYNNEPALERQMTLWSSYPEPMRRKIRFIIIDDGSRDCIKLAPAAPMNLCIARITKDIRWNQPGARNLAMALADTEWMYLSDLDHFLPVESCQRLLDIEKQPDIVYYFRERSESGEETGVHISCFCINKFTFWNLGGYDEDFCGHYGWDDFIFYDLVKKHCKVHTFDDLYLTDVDTLKTPNMRRKHRRNKRLIRKKRALLQQGKYRTKPVLRFPWIIQTQYFFDEQQPIRGFFGSDQV